MIIKNIEINHSTNKIRIIRSIKVSPELDSRGLFNFPDDVSDEGDIELKDPIPFGSSVIFPFKPNFPKDLIRFEGKRFKILTKSKNQIVGTFISYKLINNNEYIIVIDVEAYFSELSDRILPKGPFSISSLEIKEYFPLDYIVTGQFTRPKIKIESINVPREILMSYTIPFEAYSMNGYIVHSIKGIRSESLYNWDDQQLAPNGSIEITVTTTYYWSPIWTILGGDVTLTIIKDGFVYVVNNACAVRNTLSPLVLSSFTTNCSRAMLLQPDKPFLETAIYFKSLSYLSNDLVYFEDDYHYINNKDLNQIFNSNSNNNNISDSNNNISDRDNDIYNSNKFEEINKFYKYTHKILNPTKMNSFAVIRLNFQNDNNQIYNNFSYESIVSSKEKAIIFPQLKISNQCTHVDTQYSDSMIYKFLNGSKFSVGVLVYKDQWIGKNQESKSMVCSDSLKLEDSLYMFESRASSIFEFQIRVLSFKTLYLNYQLPTQIINFLNQNNLKIDLSLNVFQDISLEKFGLDFHKSLSSLFVNEKFDNKQITKPNIQDSIFEDKLFSLKDYVN